PTGTARTAPATARAGRRARRGLRARGRAAVRRSRARVQQQQGWCQPLGRAGRMESLDRWAGDDLDGLAAAQLELHGRALRHPREPGITRAVGPADLVAGDLLDDVAGDQPGGVGRAARAHRGDDRLPVGGLDGRIPLLEHEAEIAGLLLGFEAPGDDLDVANVLLGRLGCDHQGLPQPLVLGLAAAGAVPGDQVGLADRSVLDLEAPVGAGDVAVVAPTVGKREAVAAGDLDLETRDRFAGLEVDDPSADGDPGREHQLDALAALALAQLDRRVEGHRALARAGDDLELPGRDLADPPVTVGAEERVAHRDPGGLVLDRDHEALGRAAAGQRDRARQLAGAGDGQLDVAAERDVFDHRLAAALAVGANDELAVGQLIELEAAVGVGQDRLGAPAPADAAAGRGRV